MLRELDLAALRSELSPVCETIVVEDGEAARWTIRGTTPRLICKPASPEAMGAALACCGRAGAAVIPWGGGTQQRLGTAPQRADVVLLTGGLNRIIEYEPADLTVTVEAGMRLADLQRELGRNGQWLPVDPPVSDDATIGGVVATNVNGPRRLRNGGLRDLVIGTRVASADGKVTKAGGHVVKNVTGYDLNKAHIGALGTLGILVELSLKIAPRPILERSWFGVFSSAVAAHAAARTLLRLPTAPAALEILGHRSGRAVGLAVLPGQWTLLACASGFPEMVDRHLSEFESAARAAGAISAEAIADRAAQELWQSYRTMVSDLRWSAEALTCRLAVPPAEVGRLCELSFGTGDEPVVWSHGWGALFWSIPNSGLPDGGTLVEGLRRAAEAVEGALVVENWPASMAGVDVWGRPGGPLAIMEAIKRQFDPDGTLNPGRYVGGI